MGKAIIKNNLGLAEYELEVVRNTVRAEKRLKTLAARIKEYELKIIPGFVNRIAAKEEEIEAAEDELNALIETGQGEAGIKRAVDKLNGLTAELLAIDKERSQAPVILAGLKKEKLVLEETVKPDQVRAWCATYTPDLDPNKPVATIEVEGDSGKILVAPLGAAPQSDDGMLKRIMAQTPAEAFWNAAMRPGWLQWKPKHLVGEIASVDYDADTCTVAIDSLQELRENVPVKYLECDSKVFVPGDRVIVEFIDQDRTNPRVVGFESEPLHCQAPVMAVLFERNWWFNQDEFADYEPVAWDAVSYTHLRAHET